MKKILFFGISVIALFAIAAIAWTQADDDTDRDYTRRFHSAMSFGEGRYRLGVVLGQVNRADRDKWKIDSGVMVTEVVDDSAAEEAGIEEGDIILKIDGKEVSNSSDVRRLLRDLEEPKELTLEILRDGKPMTIDITPDKREVNVIRMLDRNRIGVELQELDSDLASYFQTAPDSGLLITRVERESPAAKAGMKSGDIITAINGRKVRDDADLREELDDLEKDETVEITVLRHRAEKKFTVKPERTSFEFPQLHGLERIPEMHMLRQDNMDELKQEMEELKRKLEKDLKPEIEKLKRELEQLKKSS
jgi:C-terminal processing protease CtpA/Prc